MSTSNIKKLPPYGKAASDCPDSKALVVRRGDVFQYLVHLAAENPAQIVQGRGGDRLVFAQLVDGGAGYMMIFYERIRGFRRFFQGFPEGVVNNHTIASPFLVTVSSCSLFILGYNFLLDYSR